MELESTMTLTIRWLVHYIVFSTRGSLLTDSMSAISTLYPSALE
jgi:hypothetical protein